MTDLNVIDQFMQAFIRYIDSGFGLLGGDVHFLAATLIGIDVTLAGLFWALGGEQDVMGRFLKKILYVGAFAFILNSFSTLATIVLQFVRRGGTDCGAAARSRPTICSSPAGWPAPAFRLRGRCSIRFRSCSASRHFSRTS